MTEVLLAAEDREASPIALVVILCLLVAVVLLIRSMNRHLRKVPGAFPERDERGRLLGAGPATRRAEPPDRTGAPDPARPADRDPGGAGRG